MNRRMRARKGVMQANVATAHKMARIIYFMLKHRTEYLDPGIEVYEANLITQRMKRLQRQAARLGMKLEPILAN